MSAIAPDDICLCLWHEEKEKVPFRTFFWIVTGKTVTARQSPAPRAPALLLQRAVPKTSRMRVMRLTRTILPLLFSAIAVLFSAAGLHGNLAAPVRASVESIHALPQNSPAPYSPACLLIKTSDLPLSIPDNALAITFHQNNSPRVAITARGDTWLLTGLQGTGQKKKPASVLGEKLFERYPPLRQVTGLFCFGPLLPAKSKAYEKFPFDPRSPCPSFLG